MNTLQIQYPESLQKDIDFIKGKLVDLEKTMQPKQPEVLMTRTQVAEFLHVDLSTVHNLTVKGTLKKKQLGGRVYYRRSEVESAIKAI